MMLHTYSAASLRSLTLCAFDVLCIVLCLCPELDVQTARLTLGIMSTGFLLHAGFVMISKSKEVKKLSRVSPSASSIQAKS